jgi:hypothetical protein
MTSIVKSRKEMDTYRFFRAAVSAGSSSLKTVRRSSSTFPSEMRLMIGGDELRSWCSISCADFFRVSDGDERGRKSRGWAGAAAKRRFTFQQFEVEFARIQTLDDRFERAA